MSSSEPLGCAVVPIQESRIRDGASSNTENPSLHIDAEASFHFLDLHFDLCYTALL